MSNRMFLLAILLPPPPPPPIHALPTSPPCSFFLGGGGVNIDAGDIDAGFQSVNKPVELDEDYSGALAGRLRGKKRGMGELLYNL